LDPSDPPSFYSGSYELRHPEPDTDYGLAETIQGDLDWIEIFDAPLDREQEKSAMVFKSFSMYAGSDKTYKCVVKDRALNPVNVYGGVGVMSWKRLSTDVAFVLQKSTNVPSQGSLGDPTQGELLFYLVHTDTHVLEARQYAFDVKLTLPNGKTYTVAEGTINLHVPVNP
jgi:hypothetical protein